jgi:O-antigen/teichoic acid export membrane protein
MVFAIVVARLLGDTIFGKFAFALAFTELFAVFSSLGYNTLLIREVARDKNQVNKYLHNIFGFRVLFSVVLFGLIVISINLMSYPDETKIIVYLLGIYQLLESLATVFKVTFRAFEKMEYEAAITILVNASQISFALLALFLGFGLIEIGMIFVIAAISDVILSYIVCSKKILVAKMKTEIDFVFLKQTIKIAVSLSMLSIFAMIYVKIDTVMLSLMKGDAVVGWYNAAYFLTQGLKPIPQLFMNAIFPLMSHLYVFSVDSLKKTVERAFRYLFILALPMAIGISLLAKKIILLLYGPQFIHSVIALQILSWDILLVFLYACLSFLLVSINKQYQMALMAGLTALINVVLNLILIPSYSYVGSAFATIAAEGFLLIAYIYLTARYLYVLPLQKIIVKPIISSGVMALVIYILPGMHIFLLIPIGVIVYFGMMYVLRGFSKEDISLLKHIIKK